MATEEELNRQKELNQEIRNEKTVYEELLEVLQRRVGVSSQALSGQQESLNVLQDSLKQLKFEKAERMMINQSLRTTNKIAAKNYSILSDELGTTKGLKELAKDRTTLEKEIIKLSNQKVTFDRMSKESDEERAKLGAAISQGLNQQIKELNILKGDLKDVADVSGKVAEDFGVKTFGALEDITKKIPGLRKFAEPFKEAAEAARAQAASNVLEQKRVDALNDAAENQSKVDKTALESGMGLTEEAQKRLFTEEQIAKAKEENKAAKIQREADLSSLKSGKGLTKETLKRLGIEKKFHDKDTLNALKTGKGLTKEKIKQLGLEDKLVSKTGKSLAGTSAATKARAGLLAGVKPLKSIVPKGALKGVTKAAAKTSSAFVAGAKILGKSLTKALGPIGLLLEVIMALFRGDKAAGDLAKSMNMTYNEALATRREFTMIAEESEEIFVTTKGIQESFIALNKSLGTNVMLNKDNLVFATMMREQMGFSQEAINSTFKLSTAFGKSMEDVTGEIIAQAKITSANLGVVINEKEVQEEISKVSAATVLSFKGSNRELSKAVTTAKALGMTLSQIEKTSESLLNFEQSISSELKAELLIGRNLNLERARLAAINNKVGEVAREISAQLGSAAEFGEMNRLQQKAIAEAVGMTRDELAETLFTEQAIGNATKEEADERRAVIAGMLKTMSIEEAQRKLEKEGIENLKKQASTQERFNAMLDKLTEIAVQIGEPLLEIIGPIADLAELILPKLTGAMMPIVGAIKALFLGIKGIGQAAGELLNFFGADIDTGEGSAATFNEAGEAFTRGMNVAFDRGVGLSAYGIPGSNISQLMGKESVSAQMGLDPFGIGDRLFSNNNQTSQLELDRLNQLGERNANRQQAQMQELISAVRENRQPVDVFGGTYE